MSDWPANVQEMQQVGLSWLKEVPAEWSIKPLKFNLDLWTEPSSGKGQIIALENIEGWTGRFVRTGSSFNGQGVGFEPDDILFGKLRPNLAKVFMAAESGEAIGDIWVLRPKEGCVPRYFFYQLLSGNFIDTVSASTNGAKMPRADWSYVGALPSPTPSLDEQRAIATYLDRETARIEGLIEKKDRFIALLKEKRTAVITHAVTKGVESRDRRNSGGGDERSDLFDVPAHWHKVPLKRIADIVTSGAYGDEHPSEGRKEPLRVITTAHIDPITGFRVHNAEIRYFSEVEKRIYLGQKGDIFVVKSSGSNDNIITGKRAQVIDEVDLVFSNFLLCVRAREASNDRFLYYLLGSTFVHNRIKRDVATTTYPNLKIDKYISEPLPFPPIEEQIAIATYLDRETARIDSLITKTEQSIALLKEKRAALITAAVTGKIDVRSAA